MKYLKSQGKVSWKPCVKHQKTLIYLQNNDITNSVFLHIVSMVSA